MKHLLVPFDIALQLKELGFDEPCFAYYREEAPEPEAIYEFITPFEFDDVRNSEYMKAVFAPTYQQAIDFLREHQIQVIELPKAEPFGGSSIRPHTNAWTIVDDSKKLGGSYGKALALRKAIEILKSKPKLV